MSGGGIILSKSYALYETKKEYNVIKVTVPDFGYDVKLAVIVDGEKKTDMPTSSQGENGQYYKVDVSCGSSKTEGLWDYNAWRLNLDYIESNSKCNLTFTSSMTKDQYDEYIKSGVALRRNTYRGKDITELWKSEDLYKQIEDGTFADIYVGDYIVSNTKSGFDTSITWVIADLDNYLYTGYPVLKTHHATVIPLYNLSNCRINSGVTTVGGYYNSEIVQKEAETENDSNGKVLETLKSAYKKYIEPDFPGHVLSYGSWLSDSVDSTTKKSSGAHWYNRQVDLMSEVNVFGTTIWSSSGYDVGIDNKQYALFQLKPELRNGSGKGAMFGYWLKDVADDKGFVHSEYTGDAGANYYANTPFGLRPRFLID